MKLFKFLLFAIFCLCLIYSVSAQTKKHQTIKKDKTITTKHTGKPTHVKTPFEFEKGDIKTIAEGINSKVEKPFIFVARSIETYAQLQKLVENLPSASEIDFTKTAVVAAFAGTKNTGGYSINIQYASDKIKIEVVSPPKDAILPQIITNLFEIVLVPVAQENNLSLDISSDLKKSLRSFQITKGEFSYSGGITGRGKNFQANGTIDIINFENYTTLIFNLSGKGTEKDRKLSDTASGTFKNGKIELPRLDVGSFSENPKPPVKVSGTISKEKLNLRFEPLPTTVADGFNLSGAIEAVKIK